MTDKPMAWELYLFTENDGTLYRQQAQPIIRNLAIKKIKGVYETDKALILWRHLVDSGIQKYKKEFPGYYNIDVGTKKLAAQYLANGYREELAIVVRKLKALKKAGKAWQRA